MDKTRQQQLQDEQKKLNAEIQRLKEKLAEQPDYSLGEGDPAVYEWELNFALLQRMEERARTVEAALRKLQESADGRCEVCGNEIEPERLAVLPETTLCSRCARQRAAGKRIRVG